MYRAPKQCEGPPDARMGIAQCAIKWTEIAAKLKAEKALADAARPYGVEEDASFTQPLERTCRELHINSQHCRRPILGCAERCELFHDEIGHFLETSNWPALAYALNEDYLAIPFTIPPQQADVIEDLTGLILGLRDKYFEFHQENETKPEVLVSERNRKST